MHLNLLLLPLLSLLPSTLAQAHISLYPSSSCAGDILLYCLYVTPGMCCGTSTQAYGSAKLEGSGTGWTIRGFTHPGCTGTQTSTVGKNVCLSPSFAMHSVKVVSGPKARRSLGERIVHEEQKQDCQEPDHIQFVDKAGVKRTVKIPEGKLGELVEAAREGRDVEGLL